MTIKVFRQKLLLLFSHTAVSGCYLRVYCRLCVFILYLRLFFFIFCIRCSVIVCAVIGLACSRAARRLNTYYYFFNLLRLCRPLTAKMYLAFGVRPTINLIGKSGLASK